MVSAHNLLGNNHLPPPAAAHPDPLLHPTERASAWSDLAPTRVRSNVRKTDFVNVLIDSFQERTSLLRDGERENGDAHAAPRSFGQRLADALREPLTPLTILLFVACLSFLLLSSVFIGLFAGTKHNLNLEKEKHRGEDHTITSTYTTTGTTVVTSLSSTLSTKTQFSTIFTGTTSTATKVSTFTTTSVSTKVSTAISTETETETKTKTLHGPVPIPNPTHKPDDPVHR